MKNDTRQKALFVFNFANLNKNQLGLVQEKLQVKYPEHKVFIGGKVWKKDRYKYNQFTLVIEPSIDGIDVRYKSTNVLVVTEKELTFAES